MARIEINPALEFLLVETPKSWFDMAAQELPTLLIDHANCEKKAASTALSLLYKYVDRTELLHKMSQLAREELRHFEQVVEVMTDMDIEYQHLSSARYAASLHKLVRHTEPDRLVDLLILGAVVEARSCERFVGLIKVLPEPLAKLYQQLVHSEARHFQDYLGLADAYACEDISNRVTAFLEKDAQLITSADEEFRFHSGQPA